jgi:hypothetical protein
MPLAQLLLASLAVLGIVAIASLRAPALRRALLRRRPLAVLLALSILCSAGSAVVRSSGASGTGTRTSYGFPKPFYFTWVSWEHPVSSTGFEWLYFAGNCVGWLALLSVVALFSALVRGR